MTGTTDASPTPGAADAAGTDNTPDRLTSLRRQLMELVAAALVPMLLLGLATILIVGDKFRTLSVERLLQNAQTLSHAIDHAIREDLNALRLLAMGTDHPLDARTATERWQRAGSGRHDSWIRIVEQGSPAVEGVPDALIARALATGQAQISDLIPPFGPHATPLVALIQPYRDARGQPAAIVLMQPSNALISAIRLGLDGQLTLLAVVDSEGHIAARSRNPEKFLGRPVPDWDKLQALGTDHGVFEARTQEGGEVIFSFQKLEAAPGWAVVAGEPLEVFRARWLNPLFGFAGAGAASILLALVAATLIARRIQRPAQALVARGSAIARGAPVPADSQPFYIREFDAMRVSQQAAEEALLRQADDLRALAHRLARSERRYRAVAEVGALVFWQADAQGQHLTLTGWRSLAGDDLEETAPIDWLQRAHPDDVVRTRAAWEQARVPGSALDVEFRLPDSTGGWRWVRARAALLEEDGHGEWVGVLEDVDARHRAQSRIAYLAQHDVLTGLPNRALLHDRLADAIAQARRGRNSALLCMDLDRFKEVNDSLGHALGDALLKAVTARLLREVRQESVVARLGGDEFAILEMGERQPEDASAVAARLIDEIRQPYDIDGHRLVIGISIGIAIIDQDAGDAERLLRHADLALYRVKEEGRGHFRFFEPEMDARMQRRRSLEMALHAAYANGQFELHYQPLVDLQTRTLNGFEALLRWRHPERGLLLPAEFLPLAEEIGLMVPLGRWILNQACEAAQHWPDSTTIAVNLSVSQLASDSLYDTVVTALAESGLPPRRLELEVTEDALMSNLQAASATLLRLKVAGVSIVMDDFGTGYSSLGYLRAFPFDKVKIDKSFVQDLGQAPDSDAIVGAVSHLCAQLGIVATAEGVETEAQVEWLKQQHCGEVQGFLFGKPRPAEELDSVLAAFRLT